jgi:hypothetical protein
VPGRDERGEGRISIATAHSWGWDLDWSLYKESALSRGRRHEQQVRPSQHRPRCCAVLVRGGMQAKGCAGAASGSGGGESQFGRGMLKTRRPHSPACPLHRTTFAQAVA